MDIKDLNKYYKQTELDKLHIEFFKESPEYKYYLLGVAQGLYTIYKAMSVSFAKNVRTDDWMQFIKKIAADDKKVEEYFARLINADNKI
jgi:hypothetical protein